MADLRSSRDEEGEERGGWAHDENSRGDQGRAREWEEAERQSREVKLGLHPLQTRYVLWYTRRQRQPPGQRSATSYEDSIRRIADFSTVEGFWVCYCRMVRPSALPAPTDVHVFKDGIRPLWEDEHNRRGGKWMVRLRKPLTARMWEHLLMAVVGEQLEGAEEVCGVVLSVRFGEDILSIWNRSAPHSLARDRLCESIRKHLGLPPSYTMEYKPHDASLKDHSSYRNTWTTFLLVVLASAILLSSPARVSAAANATSPANKAASAKASSPANVTGAVVATARQSKGAGEGKNSTCAYYGNYNTNPYFNKGLTAKLPPAEFGKRCGACYRVVCTNDTKRCHTGKATVTVRVVGETTTKKQLSLSTAAWSKIVQGSDSSPVSITYKRANCVVSTLGSGVRVRRNSTAEKFNIQMVGLAGPGTLKEVELSADGKKWAKLTRDGSKAVWGIVGAEAKEVVGAKKAMSVRLTAGHTLEKITLANAIPADWKPATVYASKANFKKMMAESK
ncbi:unnamed protein product [Closterium sp. NIES-53]